MHTQPSVFGVKTDLKHDTIHASTIITHCIQTDERNEGLRLQRNGIRCIIIGENC